LQAIQSLLNYTANIWGIKPPEMKIVLGKVPKFESNDIILIAEGRFLCGN
jgi:hypothetical protein